MPSYLCVIEGPTDEVPNWGGYTVDLRVSTTGQSRDEVLQLLQEGMALHIEWLQEDGVEVPAPTTTEAEHRAALEADEDPEISNLNGVEFLMLKPISPTPENHDHQP
ncbi:hypothetical protein DAETH_09990 [Deinococcus aetherius]|uniref:HicB-like antitoxin of toxin-antitoxin system domain-containing protein n=1 Tax=Deinococcus aetherius TaxID=200252 RepID=A0ABN6RCE2_9DEIO|nr:type II toxin-antitoxin system HicB family antitoxin [Deinococcus aetherius]BDP41030.1 hypothetical protein DAETH_09990 [Deinococcus aetherius]